MTRAILRHDDGTLHNVRAHQFRDGDGVDWVTTPMATFRKSDGKHCLGGNPLTLIFVGPAHKAAEIDEGEQSPVDPKPSSANMWA